MERSARDIANEVRDLVTDPWHTTWQIPVLLIGELSLCGLIIRTVPYTEIDWVAYMQQVKQYIAGERDYALIRGDTGPLVYPALHVYIYRGLYAITNQGRNIILAQALFAFLYVFNLGLAMLCYRQAKVPPYILPMMVLSKRLHSIYVLRCFNDCFAMTALFATIYLFQQKQWSWGSLAFSAGLAIKMNLLLVAPAVAVILYQALGPYEMLTQAFWMLQLQLGVALPFLRQNANSYLLQAFDIRRQFMYRWTVNWKFIKEETFLSPQFAVGLLIMHASLLSLFLVTRWIKPLERSPTQALRYLFVERSPEAQKRIASRVTPVFIMTTMLTSNAIGMLCARSLHYQFYSWIAWATPYLLWRSELNLVLIYFLWLGQELAWNMYPANELSSKIVVGVLGAVIVEVWLATDEKPKRRETVSAEMLKDAQKKKGRSQNLESQENGNAQAESKS